MSIENLDMSKFKKKEDLPDRIKDQYENVEGGFVKRTAVEKEDFAKDMAISLAFIGEDTSPEFILQFSAQAENKAREEIKKGNLSMENIFYVKDDLKIMKELINKDPNLLRYASDEIRNNKEVVLNAVKKNPLTMQYVSDSLAKELSTIIIENGDKKQKEESFRYLLEMVKDVDNTDNFDELYDVIKKYGEKISFEPFVAQEVIDSLNEIERVRNGKKDIEELKLQNFVVYKVKKLIEQEK